MKNDILVNISQIDPKDLYDIISKNMYWADVLVLYRLLEKDIKGDDVNV